jgi:hypothetical protein
MGTYSTETLPRRGAVPQPLLASSSTSRLPAVSRITPQWDESNKIDLLSHAGNATRLPPIYNNVLVFADYGRSQL